MKKVLSLPLPLSFFLCALAVFVVGPALSVVAQTTKEPTASPTADMGPVWAGCASPDDDTVKLVTRGEDTYVCLTLGPDGDWAEGVSYTRWLFRPKADQYSRFHIPRSYNDIVADPPSNLGKNTTVHTSSQASLSFLRGYLHRVSDVASEDDRIFPYTTAIIDVQDGIVKGIAWDDACVFCSSGTCLENTYNFAGTNSVDLDPPLSEPTKGCYLTRKQCDEIISKNETSTDCDLTLYIVWTGTDSEGDSMSSSLLRFSAFPAKRIRDRFKLPSLNISLSSINPFD